MILYKNVKLASTLCMVIVMTSACSSKNLKQENVDLMQKVKQEEQTRQDYADKLSTAEKMSKQERNKTQVEMAAMRRDLNNALQENQVTVKELENLTIVEMEHSVLFKSGQAELSQDGKSIVKDIAAAFNKYPGYHMRIEGHTDNMPIHTKLKQRYDSNWELSAARATTVVKYMISTLNVPGKNLSIAGYSDNRPIASNDTEEGRAKNRRIRAVIFKNRS